MASIQCPKCRELLESEVMVSHRSFVCPRCRAVLWWQSAHNRLGSIGCFTVFVVGGVVLILIGVHWLLGLIAGVLAGIISANLVVWASNRLWPRPPVLAVNEYGLADPQLAELLEQIAEAKEWTKELDDLLRASKQAMDYDCMLAGDAIDAAQDCRDILKGDSHKRRNPKATSLEELRQELRAIARDIRLASK